MGSQIKPKCMFFLYDDVEAVELSYWWKREFVENYAPLHGGRLYIILYFLWFIHVNYLSIFIKFASLLLGQWYECFTAVTVVLKDMGKHG